MRWKIRHKILQSGTTSAGSRTCIPPGTGSGAWTLERCCHLSRAVASRRRAVSSSSTITVTANQPSPSGLKTVEIVGPRRPDVSACFITYSAISASVSPFMFSGHLEISSGVKMRFHHFEQETRSFENFAFIAPGSSCATQRRLPTSLPSRVYLLEPVLPDGGPASVMSPIMSANPMAGAASSVPLERITLK